MNNYEDQVLKTAMDTKLRESRMAGAFVATVPYTPIDLCRNIFSQIPTITERRLSAKIAVLFTVEMAVQLRKWGFTDVTLITDVTCPKSQNIAALIGFAYKTVEQIKEMKFDVVVGNPPYQNGHKQTIFGWFYTLSNKITKSTGWIGMVAPTTWMNSNKKLLKDIKTELFESGLVSAVCFNPKSVFGNDIQIDACGYTIQNRSLSSVSEVRVKRVDGVEVVLLKNSGLMGTIKENAIIQKCRGVPSMNLQSTSHANVNKKGTNYNGTCSLIQSNDHPFRMINKINATGPQYAFVNKQVPKSRPGTWKAMFNYITSKNNVGYVHVTNEDVELSHMCMYVEVQTEAEAESIKSYWESAVFQYLLPRIRPNTTNTVGVFRPLKLPPLDRIWTNDDLYTYFEFTKEEIEMIQTDS